MKLCTFDYVGETNTLAKFGLNPPTRAYGVASRMREICISCNFSSFLPFFLRTCTGQMNRDPFTHNGSKDAVWRKEVPSQQMFVLYFDVLVVILPQNPKNVVPSQARKVE